MKKQKPPSRKLLYLIILGLLVSIAILTFIIYTSPEPETNGVLFRFTGFSPSGDVGVGGVPGASGQASSG